MRVARRLTVGQFRPVSRSKYSDDPLVVAVGVGEDTTVLITSPYNGVRLGLLGSWLVIALPYGVRIMWVVDSDITHDRADEH